MIDYTYNAIIKANVINSANHLCNHLSIYCKFNITMLNLTVEQEARRHNPNWDKANPDDRNNYRETLSDILTEINPPKQCNQCYTLNCGEQAAAVDVYASTVHL